MGCVSYTTNHVYNHLFPAALCFQVNITPLYAKKISKNSGCICHDAHDTPLKFTIRTKDSQHVQ